MALPKPTRVWGLPLITAAVVGAGTVAAFTAGAAGGGRGTITARYATTADWGTGFQGEYTISNGTGHPVHAWTVSFDLPTGERISSLWNGTMTTAGQHVTVTNPAGGADIATGRSTSFGFVVDAAAGPGVPGDCRINGASCRDGASDDRAAAAPTTVGGSSAPTSALPTSAPPTSAPPTSAPPTSAPPTSAPPTSASPTAPSAAPSSAAPGSSAYKFAPYVDTSQRRDLGTLASAAGVKYVTAAFVLSGDGCAPAWNGGGDDAGLKAGLADLRARGGDAIASFGGAHGTELALVCPDDTSLEAAYRAIIDEYDLTHLDFDVEGTAGADQAAMARRWRVLAQLQSDYAAAGKTLDVSLTLPVLPSGLTPQGLDVVSTAVASNLKLSVINVMAMDYGDWAAPNPAGRMGWYAEQAAQSLHDQLRTVFPAMADDRLWAMVGITPMIGANDTAGETFQLADAEALVRFATQHHIGRLAMWSLTRNEACAQACPDDFSHAFGAFTG